MTETTFRMNFSRRRPAADRRDDNLAAGQVGVDFEAVFQQYWEPVCAVIYRIVGDWAEAEDLALEVFLQLHARPPSQVSSQLSGWLYRVGTNLGLNALRSRKRRVLYEAQAARHAALERPVDDPAGVLERSQERRQVQAVLAVMKPRAAQLLILRQAGLSYAEIAQALSVAPGSVGTLLARAEADFARRYRREY
jgi:RNA polymerase sigma-70 factor (ECF subfamily)